MHWKATLERPECHWRGLPLPTEAEWRARICRCPQAVAYFSHADIIGTGGGAGGGKSAWENGSAMTQHRRSIVYRREKTQARDLMAAAEEFLRNVGEPYEARHSPATTIYIPRLDALIEYGGIQSSDDWRKQMGRPRDGIFFDEATEFEELMIRSLIAWNRTTIAGQRCQIGMGFNPPTIKHGIWLISFFGPWLDKTHPNPAEYGELRWFITVDDKDIEVEGPDPVERETKEGRRETFAPLSRTFIKALVDDNEYYRDGDYKRKLMNLPGTMRRQLLYGDFDVEEVDEPNQTIPTRWLLLANERWLEMQDAATTPDGKPDAPLSAVGADPARGGTNKTSFVARIGTWFDYPETHPGSETQDGAEVVRRLALFMARYRRVRDVVVGMDVIGVGGSPVDEGRRQGMAIVGMAGGDGAPENATDRSGLLGFANLRAYWYWSLREALDPIHGQNLAIPPDRELLADLCAPKYDDRSLRGITIEKKADIAKRLGRSPDKGDAFVYAFAVRPFIVGYRTVQTRSPGPKAFAPTREKRDRWR